MSTNASTPQCNLYAVGQELIVVPFSFRILLKSHLAVGFCFCTGINLCGIRALGNLIATRSASAIFLMQIECNRRGGVIGIACLRMRCASI